MDSIFCFKFNDITGKVTRIEISEYRIQVNASTGKKTYLFANTITQEGSNYRVSEDKFDRFVSNKVFSFDDSYSHAYKIMKDDLEEAIGRLEREYKRKQSLLALYWLNKAFDDRK